MSDVKDSRRDAERRRAQSVGNMAKMREALVQVELFLSLVERHGHPTLNPGDKCVACKGVEELRTLVCEALAAPARNCDVYDKEEVRMAYHLQGDGLMTMQAVVDWLYSAKKRGDESPRTEQEGEVRK